MKKLLPIFLVVFAILIFQYSFAAMQVQVYTSWTQGSIVTTSPSTGAHNNKACSIPDCPGGGWHCPICGCDTNHYNNGDYEVEPVCDCASKFRAGTIPAGYKYVRSGSEPRNHPCGNLSGMQQQEIQCTWYYSIYEEPVKTSPSPTPSPSSNLGTVGDGWGGMIGGGLSPSPSPTSTPCPHSNIGNNGYHNHRGDIGSKATANSRRFGSTIDTEESYRRENPFNVGSTFSLTVDGHISGKVVHIPDSKPWTCGGYDERYCRDCGEVFSHTLCRASGRYNDWTKNEPTFTDTYHNVIMSFEGFTVDGVSEIDFSHLSKTYSAWSQNSFSSTRDSADYVITSLDPSKLKEDDGKYGDKSSGLVTEEPSNNNQGRDTSPRGGFWERGDNNFGSSPWGNWWWLFGGYPGGGYNQPTPGEGSNTPNPGENGGGTPVGNGGSNNTPSAPTGKSGLLYGYAYVKCDCGCTRDKYRIYFDLTPVLPPTENKYTLTVKADGAPITGGVKINGDSDYKDYSQKESPIGDSFSIDAQANNEKGYKFDAWYKTNGDKYSKEKTRSIIMPGFNFTLIARFLAEERYNVTVYSDGNGDVKFDGKYDDGQEGWDIYANVIKGDNIGIIAKPYENYVVDYWELINDNSSLGTEGKIELTDVRENCIIFVHFKPIDPSLENYKQLITSSVGYGIAIGGTDYAIPGNDYPIWAIPYTGAVFNLWTHQLLGIGVDKVSEYGAEDIIKMPNDGYKLVAYFEPYDNKIYHLVIVESDGNGDISINDDERRGKDSINVEDGTEITIKAYPDEGYEFEYWSDEEGNIVSKEQEFKIKITEDKIYVAHFKYVGTGETFELNVESAGGGKAYRDVENAIVGEEYLIEAVPNRNCEFLYWEDKETGEITDYAEYDYIIMPNRDITLVAHFRELVIEEDKDKYHLTLKTEGGGSATGGGDYPPDEPVYIKATPNAGYEFVGWYEDNQLISIVAEYPPIKMPYYDMTLTAVFKKSGDNGENSPFRILSIRDVRWKDYFTSNGSTTNNEIYVPKDAIESTILVNDAKLVDSSYEQYEDIVYGYAVEFELVTTGIEKNDSKLVVIPKVYEKTSSGRMNEISSIDLKDYDQINSGDNNSVEKFMITGEQEMIGMPNNQTAPQVTWRWVWYLPLDIYEDICGKVGRNSDIVVNFEIYVETSAGKRFDYVQAINYLNRSSWGGNVFTYRLDKTLLTDIYDNATN